MELRFQGIYEVIISEIFEEVIMGIIQCIEYLEFNDVIWVVWVFVLYFQLINIVEQYYE